MTLARLEASEHKVSQLEERIVELERRTSKIDGIAEGVQILLERLENFSSNDSRGSSRPKPSATAVYSIPIDGDPFVGPEHAKVTMVKGFDFYCIYCDRVRPVLDQLRNEYGDQLKIVYKNFVIHDDYARLPALAACAAHEQGKFMPMFKELWVRGLRARQELTEERLLAIAADFNLDMKKFAADMYGPCEAKIRKDFEIFAAVGASGTPSFYINGRYLAGALPIARYRRVIDEELAKANRAIEAGAKVESYYDSIVASGKKNL